MWTKTRHLEKSLWIEGLVVPTALLLSVERKTTFSQRDGCLLLNCKLRCCWRQASCILEYSISLISHWVWVDPLKVDYQVRDSWSLHGSSIHFDQEPISKLIAALKKGFMMWLLCYSFAKLLPKVKLGKGTFDLSVLFLITVVNLKLSQN